MGAGLLSFAMTRIKTIDAEVAGEAVRLIVSGGPVGARAHDGGEAERGCAGTAKSCAAC